MGVIWCVSFCIWQMFSMWLTSYITPKLSIQRNFKIWIGFLKLLVIVLSLGVIWVNLVCVWQIIWLWLTSYITPQTFKWTKCLTSKKFSEAPPDQTKKVTIFDLWFDMNVYTEAVVQRCSVKKIFLEISQNSQEHTSARVSFLIKLQA